MFDKDLTSICSDTKHPVIFITGLSGSGKSTIVKSLSQCKKNFEVISLDSITDKLINKEYPDWKKLGMKQKNDLWIKMSLQTVMEAIRSLDKDKKYIIEGIQLLCPACPKLLKNQLNIFVDAPLKTIIERRTRREIKRKEIKLKRKLTDKEIESKYRNSKTVIRSFLPFVKKYIKEVKPIIIKNY